MDSHQLLDVLNAKIDQLRRVRELLSGEPVRTRKQHIVTKPTRTMSPEGRARVAAAQRARWAKQRQQRKA
jgi:hypothetical protein